jgi:hypothetical protein
MVVISRKKVEFGCAAIAGAQNRTFLRRGAACLIDNVFLYTKRGFDDLRCRLWRFFEVLLISDGDLLL